MGTCKSFKSQCVFLQDTNMADGDCKSKACNNFLRQFRDKDTNELKKFTATQFMDVWNHYDDDGR